MEEIQNSKENSNVQVEEPIIDDNSSLEQVEIIEPKSKDVLEEGQSFTKQEEDPSEELILGKFKTVEDLKKAYEELQKHQGQSSEELGNLRKEMNSVNKLKECIHFFNAKKEEFLDVIQRDFAKYNSPEYFQDPTFKEIYQEALLVYGNDLDTERMIDLIENYVSARIQHNEKKKLANSETQNILDSMSFEKNTSSSFTPPKKTFDEMTPKEIDELLDRLI